MKRIHDSIVFSRLVLKLAEATWIIKMFWCYGFLNFFLLLSGTYGNVELKNRVRRQDSSAQSRQLIDDIFNVPITAIRQTASVAQVISPENTQTINNIFQIPVSTLEAVGALVKSARQQNIENNQTRLDRRERILALKEQKRKRKEENQRLEQRLKRTVKYNHNDLFGLNLLSNLLVNHYGGLFDHHPGLGGIHGNHHKIGHHLHGHGIHHGGHLVNRPQHTYEVHENVNEDTSFAWHGLTAGIGSFYGARPSSTSIKIENKIAPKENEEKIFKYSNFNSQNKKIKNIPIYNDNPPLENKIAPRNGKIAFI